MKDPSVLAESIVRRTCLKLEIKLSRKEREKKARKKEILESAARLFSDKDFHEVTVEEIANDVELSKGTLYLYFKNKDDLFFSIVVEKTQDLSRKLKDAVGTCDSFDTCLRNVVAIHCIFFQENVAFFKIMQSEKTRMSTESHYRLHDYVEEMFETYMVILTDLVKKGQKQDVLRGGDPTPLVKAFRGILNSFVFYYVFTQREGSLTDEIDEIVDLFLNGAKSR